MDPQSVNPQGIGLHTPQIQYKDPKLSCILWGWIWWKQLQELLHWNVTTDFFDLYNQITGTQFEK